MTELQKSIIDLIVEAPHMTAHDIAETVGVSIPYVYTTARANGLKMKSNRNIVTERDRNRILSMAKARISDDVIAARLSFHPDTIQRHRLKMGCLHPTYVRPRQFSPEEQKKIADMHLVEGRTYREIGKMMNVTRCVVAGIVFRAKRKLKQCASVEREVETV